MYQGNPQISIDCIRYFGSNYSKEEREREREICSDLHIIWVISLYE